MGKLYIVATPLGNLGDISQRALEILNSVSLIAVEDTRRTRQLLNHFDIKTELISNHKFNEASRVSEIIDKIIAEDKDVALVSDAGTPCISDPGAYLVKKARESNIETIAIPGASAVIAALSVSGFIFNEFAFLGFIPRKNKDKEVFFNNINESNIDVFVLFESPKRILKSLKDIELAIDNLNIFVANDITKYYEYSYWGNISDVIKEIESNPKHELGEYTIVLQTVKKQEDKATNEKYSLEASLVDIIIKNDCTMKDAINILHDKSPEISKKEIYDASLNIKKIFSN